MIYKYAWTPKKVETWRVMGGKYWVWLQEYKISARTCMITGEKFPYQFVTKLDGFYWRANEFPRIRTALKHLKKGLRNEH